MNQTDFSGQLKNVALSPDKRSVVIIDQTLPPE